MFPVVKPKCGKYHCQNHQLLTKVRMQFDINSIVNKMPYIANTTTTVQLRPLEISRGYCVLLLSYFIILNMLLIHARYTGESQL